MPGWCTKGAREAIAKRSGCATQQAGWSISDGSWGSPGSSTVPAGPPARGCLCPAEVTLAEANTSITPPQKNESNGGKSSSGQDGITQGSCSASQCQPTLGTGWRNSRGRRQAALGIPAAATQLAWQAGDQDMGEKGAHQEHPS